jgi:hypothetical protein
MVTVADVLFSLLFSTFSATNDHKTNSCRPTLRIPLARRALATLHHKHQQQISISRLTKFPTVPDML